MARWIALASMALLACGGAKSPRPIDPPTAPPNETATPIPTATPIGSPLPAKCASDAKDCAPPSDFVDRLCAKPHQDMALALFAKGSPWTRAYLRGKFDELAFDEEVLLLRFHAPPQAGMIVGSGKGSYDVLRWDGSCAAAVDTDMITRTRPPRPKSAHVQWSRVSSKTQDALLASEGVKRAWSRRGKECKGATSGEVSAACERADAALVDAVVDQVRTQGGLPEPDPVY